MWCHFFNLMTKLDKSKNQMQITDQIYSHSYNDNTAFTGSLKNINQDSYNWSQQSSNLVRLVYWLVMDVCSEDFFFLTSKLNTLLVDVRCFSAG